jgi:TRAP-type C4-dicarboxylate transport system permease small subunit
MPKEGLVMPEEGPVVASLVEQPPSANEYDELEQLGLGMESAKEVLPAREPFRSLLHWLGLVEQTVGALLVVVILALVLIQVGQRSLPGGGWAWTGEIARFAMVWATFAMAGYLMAHDGHIAIKVVDYFMPVRALGTIKLLGHVLVAVTCIALVFATYDFMTHDRGQVTPAAEIPLALIYAVVALGYASTALRAVVTILVLDLRELRTGERGVA